MENHSSTEEISPAGKTRRPGRHHRRRRTHENSRRHGPHLLGRRKKKIGKCKLPRRFSKMRDMNDNSGVYIRIPVEPREPWMARPLRLRSFRIDNHPETSNEDDTHITGNSLFPSTRPLAKTRQGPDPNGTPWKIALDGPPHRRLRQRRKSHRLHRRPACPRKEIRF